MEKTLDDFALKGPSNSVCDTGDLHFLIDPSIDLFLDGVV